MIMKLYNLHIDSFWSSPPILSIAIPQSNTRGPQLRSDSNAGGPCQVSGAAEQVKVCYNAEGFMLPTRDFLQQRFLGSGLLRKLTDRANSPIRTGSTRVVEFFSLSIIIWIFATLFMNQKTSSN